MKVTKAQATQNREAILRAAAKQIRSHGFEQMSVAEVARAAGLSHGALYSHFKSKEALQAEAARQSFDDTIAAFTGLGAEAFITTYLSPQHRDNPDMGCPNAALVSEVWRQPAPTQEAFRAGIERFVALSGAAMGEAGDEADRDRAITLFAALVGGMALSRAIGQVDQAYADDLLRAVSSQLQAFLARGGPGAG
jgi:TetR/AcrR family transcriptional regulator, transcriptional repressor for nem operon